ncbi:Dps family protein [Leptotrichia sp. oral taxon 847]|uniref:Dps family protein n=1 Tax=Leptotrichia sp. oral taxon 847 TaxID=1785996 RepID=UPI000767EE85|nr:DNA starvation/stationary phase protection protein [Leptotrichia sp. oral taxon 847]AMD94914.1 DNA starvation/stationary phase protection protein [Leptotrichia sp. oral taxon 847]
MSKTVEKLNLYLANLNVLYRKVQNYHWNIVGSGFFSVHAKLEEYYDGLNTQIDDVAERILAIGGRPLGTLKDYLAVSTIKEAENKEISISDAIADVIKEFEAMLKLVKEVKVVADEENDYGTSALVDEYISTYEKDLWMLNAYLK